MRLLRYVKHVTWEALSRYWAANDFVFTREFEETASPGQLAVLRRLILDDQDCLALSPKALTAVEPEVARFLRARDEVIPRYFDDILSEVDFSKYSLVGFTCLFDQTIASLALARRIKRRYPDMMIAFGGYALERPVGPALQKSFAEMDVVAYGDGEPAIFPLWEASCGLRSLAEVPNISYRDHEGKIVDSESTVKIELDTSPTPDFDDFFVQREELRDTHGVSIMMGETPVESSRGCWYGQKAHCVFCGIDDETLRYRVKTPAVTIAQLDQLHRRYNVSAFRFSDYIMPLGYYKTFLPEMVRRGSPYTLHYETKANLRAEQIDLCAAAGIRFLQPGIESFSSSVLKLMAKGVTAAQNIFTLCAMHNNGIHPFYNLIFGFPREDWQDYENMIRILPCLYHLVPPQTTVPVLVTRYAPLHTDPRRFGATGPLRAHWRYDVIFSPAFRRENEVALESFCYYFDSPYREFGPELSMLHKILQHQVLKWRDRCLQSKARLIWKNTGDDLVIEDTRLSDTPIRYRLGRTHQLLASVLRTALFTRARLLDEMARQGAEAKEAEAALAGLIEARVVLEVDSFCVWLPLPEGRVETVMQIAPERSNTEVRSSRDWPSVEVDSLLVGAYTRPESNPLIVLKAESAC